MNRASVSCGIISVVLCIIKVLEGKKKREWIRVILKNNPKYSKLSGKNQPINLSSQKPKPYIIQNILPQWEVNFLLDECPLKGFVDSSHGTERRAEESPLGRRYDCEL